MRADWDCCGVAMLLAVALELPGASAGTGADVDEEGLDEGSALAATTTGDVCAVDNSEDTEAPGLSLLAALASFLGACFFFAIDGDGDGLAREGARGAQNAILGPSRSDQLAL